MRRHFFLKMFGGFGERIYLCNAYQIHLHAASNAEILRNLGTIAEDEDMLTRVAKYLRKLVVQKKDPTLFTKEEFLARVDEARKQPGKSFANVDELDQYIRNL